MLSITFSQSMRGGWVQQGITYRCWPTCRHYWDSPALYLCCLTLHPRWHSQLNHNASLQPSTSTLTFDRFGEVPIHGFKMARLSTRGEWNITRNTLLIMKYMLDRTSTERVCKSNDVSMMIQWDVTRASCYNSFSMTISQCVIATYSLHW